MMNSSENPFELFAVAFEAAKVSGMSEPTAFCLSTVGRDGRPSSRMVLLKHFDERGFVFYTNFSSRKGRELADNPNTALCFYWPQIGRQIRIEGPATPIDDAEADEYFESRDRGSQIGAWASLQSSTLANHDELVARVAAIESQYADRNVPRPPHWSGFRVRPVRFEFWTAGEHRLHERRVFEAANDGHWSSHMLYP